MGVLLTGARVVSPGDDLGAVSILIEDGVIAEVGPQIEAEGAERIDLGGRILAPGFIDLHVHGGGGHSLITSDPGQIRAYARWAPSRGVTSFLPTVCTPDLDTAVECLAAAAAEAARSDDGARVLGVNLEGPFVSPDRRGALPPTWPVAPGSDAFRRLHEASAGTLRLITIAPELPAALGLIREASAAGVRVSVGHTDATYEIAREAFAAGATHVTHAFNAMRPFHHREPGPIGAALEAQDVTVEVIADGVHLHPATVRTLVSAFGPNRIALITDGVTPAGLSGGTFRIGETEARIEEGAMRLPDGTIAGSVATMADVLLNLVRWDIADVASAAKMAAATPARALGLDGRLSRIAPGCDADLVALTEDLQVARTWVAGREVWTA